METFEFTRKLQVIPKITGERKIILPEQFNKKTDIYEIFDIYGTKCYLNYKDINFKLNNTPKSLYLLLKKILPSNADILLFCDVDNNLVKRAHIYMNNYFFHDNFHFKRWVFNLPIKYKNYNEVFFTDGVYKVNRNIYKIPYSIKINDISNDSGSIFCYYDPNKDEIVKNLQDFLKLRNIQDLFVQNNEKCIYNIKDYSN